MRHFAWATLLGVAFLLGSPIAGQAAELRQGTSAPGRATSTRAGAPITLQVSAGYQNIYRGTAWTPIRVTLHNTTSTDVSGSLEIPQPSQSASIGATPSFHSLYQAPVILPAGGTRHVTVYVPGSGVQGQVNARFLEGARTVASTFAYPQGIDSSALLIGVMAHGPEESGWIAPSIQQQVTTHVVNLSPAAVDPVSQALATFDILVVTDVDTSQLDSAQLHALQGYVENGGSLILIGGPSWPETLRPLPTSLLPGKVVGTRILPDLHGVYPLGPIIRPSGFQKAAVSVLSHPEGTVVASQAGVPLVVRRREGQGAIEYVAFDPALDPVQSWQEGARLRQHLLSMAAPFAISRTWAPGGFRARFQAAFSTQALTSELSNLPPSTLPLLAIFAALTLLYVVVLGPANFLLLRWMGRQQLAWITIPALALAYIGSALGITTQARGSSTVLNSIGMVSLDGRGSERPTTLYLGLVASLPGDYHLTYRGTALPLAVPQFSRLNGFFWRSASTLHTTPLGLRLEEGPQTEATLLDMQRWATRDLMLKTQVQIPGSVQGRLVVDALGNIGGTIHNGTNLDLQDPVLVVGQTFTHLPDLRAGARVATHLEPSGDFSNQDPSSLWAQLYGNTDLGGDFGGFGGFRGCCDQFSFPPEKTLLDRVRNAVSVLSQQDGGALSSLGDAVLVGWTEQPLGAFTVDGSAPQRRELTLVVTPLSLHLPAHGPFDLRAGTLSSHLVDMVPRAPQSNSFGFFDGSNQQVSVGAGGSLTFEFDLPRSGHLQFQQLAVGINAQDDGTGAGSVYDWHTQRWVSVDLSNGSAQLRSPNRFVSPTGQVLLKIVATQSSGDLTISDPYHDVQLSGRGTVT